MKITAESNADGAEQLKAIIRKLPKAQRKMLDELSCGGNTNLPRKVAKALESKGLIFGIQRSSCDRFGLMTWVEYAVPLAVHIAWCEISSEEFDALSPEEQAAMERAE